MELDTQQKIPPTDDKRRRWIIDRDFGWLWLGHSISTFGTRAAGLSFVAILVLGATPVQLGWLEAMTAFPVLLISLFAGMWVDRVVKRPLLILMDMGRALLLLSIPLATALGFLSMPQLYLVAALVGALSVVFEVANQALFPVLVPRERIVEGNSKLEATSAVAEIVGPSSGGLLVQMIGAPLTVCLDALTYLASALCITLIRTKEPAPVATESTPNFWQEISEGLRILFNNPLLRATTTFSLLRFFFGGAFATLYGLYILHVLGVAPAIYGLLVTMGGIGGLVGAFMTGKVVARFGIGPTLVFSGLIGGAIALLTPLAAGPVVVILGLLMLGQLLGDCGGTIYGINEVSLRQSIVPQHKLGRVNAGVQFLVGGISPLGAVVAGIVSEMIGVRPTLLVGAIGMLLASACLLFSPLRRFHSS